MTENIKAGQDNSTQNYAEQLEFNIQNTSEKVKVKEKGPSNINETDTKSDNFINNECVNVSKAEENSTEKSNENKAKSQVNYNINNISINININTTTDSRENFNANLVGSGKNIVTINNNSININTNTDKDSSNINNINVSELNNSIISNSPIENSHNIPVDSLVKPSLSYINYKNSIEKNKAQLKICCITWNMHGEDPTLATVEDLLTPHQSFDIYAIGSEECMRSIFKSFFISDKSEWENKISQTLGEEYHKLRVENLGAIHLAVFIKKKYLPFVGFLGGNSVKTGANNLLGNKGGVGIWFRIFDLNLLIINAHLAANQPFVQKRNEDFSRIMSNMNNSYINFDMTIFMGDLNYRLTNTKIDKEKLRKNHMKYYAYDQLQLERNVNNYNFIGFKEEKINFMPTFKYWNGTDEFEYNGGSTEKDINNIPAWTDRILYKKSAACRKTFELKVEKYDSMQHILMSDHKPVFAYFLLSAEISEKKAKALAAYEEKETGLRRGKDSNMKRGSKLFDWL